MSGQLTEEILYTKTPQELTLLLYQALEERMAKAMESIQTNHYEEANRHLQMCNDLLYRLGAGINYEAGIIADQLEVIYQYLADRIIQANINKDAQIVEECLRIVSILKEAWQIAISKMADQTSLVRLSKTLAYETSYESLKVDVKE